VQRKARVSAEDTNRQPGQPAASVPTLEELSRHTFLAPRTGMRAKIESWTAFRGSTRVPDRDDGFVEAQAPTADPLSDPDRAASTGAVEPAPTGRVRRLLRPRGGRRMRHPDDRRHYRTLAVADVDLDAGSATLLSPFTPVEAPAEGVHALVWFHGEPIGELTVPGDPGSVITALPKVAARELEQAVLEHLLRDALATRGGVAEASRRGLAALPHPKQSRPDGSQVTVAVCTRDRPEDLRRCLTAIDRLETRPAEVLVVDNASRDDRTRQVAKEFGVRYVWEPRAGLDWARNRALLESTTRIVAFTDDDVLVHPRWVQGLLRAFDEEPDAVAVTGLVAPAELATPAQILFEAFGGFGRGYARQWMSVTVEAGEVAAQLFPGTGGAGTGANMALLREYALALGGFDPALDVGTRTGGGGDLEMYFRVLASGGLLVYEPSAVVRHVHRRTMPELVRQMRGNGTGNYSIFAGAGPRYGAVQACAFLVFAGQWAARHQLKANIRSLLWPRMWPPSVALAESGGMLTALLRRYYAQARAQAAAQCALHPDEPQAPALVHPRPKARTGRAADPVSSLDLLGDPPDHGDLCRPTEDWRAARRLRVRVERDGQPQVDVPIWTRGSCPTPARLRWEIVRRLGPAVLAPGTAWADLWLDAKSDRRRGSRSLADALMDRLTHPAAPLPAEATISILVTTPGRFERVRRHLAALLATTSRTLQVIVVDTSVQAADAAVLEGLPGLHVVHEPRRGPAAARNAAIPVLAGDIVVFVDDDVLPADDWLEALLEPFTDPSVSVVTGNVLPADPAELDAQLIDDLGRLGGGPHRVEYDGQWLRNSRGPAHTWRIGGMGNAAIRRDVLHRIGEFSTTLGAGGEAAAAGDAEYLYRVLRDGGRVVYQPTAVALRRPGAEQDPLRVRLRASAARHVAYQLEVLTRYGDVRGLGRIAVALPRTYLRRAWWILQVRDDYPAGLLAAEVQGSLIGIPSWIRARWVTR
jgi:O-antigen biosynthesis protein